MKRTSERRKSSNCNMNPQATSLTGEKSRRGQDPRTKWKTKDSWSNFLTAWSVLLETMINIFQFWYFQCQLCKPPRKIEPARPGNFRKHLERFHAENRLKCQWPDCIYVRIFSICTLSTLFVQETAEQRHMKRHVDVKHKGLERLDCPSCGVNIQR